MSFLVVSLAGLSLCFPLLSSPAAADAAEEEDGGGARCMWCIGPRSPLSQWPRLRQKAKGNCTCIDNTAELVAALQRLRQAVSAVSQSILAFSALSSFLIPTPESAVDVAGTCGCMGTMGRWMSVLLLGEEQRAFDARRSSLRHHRDVTATIASMPRGKI